MKTWSTLQTWAVLAVPLGLAIAGAADGPRRYRPRPLSAETRDGSAALAAKLDASLQAAWSGRALEPSAELDDLAFARRLWLDLLGTVPSLEELRAIEERPAVGRRAWLIDRALSDPRFASTLAEQLTRIVVGANSKQDDLLYRRRRMVDWLTQQVARHRPWDALVRDLITAEGLSTDAPAVNFVISQDRDAIKLAGRSARAFLGIRLDCAQCHDHPFTDWKQSQFEGLAAFFARLQKDNPAVRDVGTGELELDALPVAPGMASTTAMTLSVGTSASSGGPPAGKRWVGPSVPFDPGLLPSVEGDEGRRRALAAWITHPENAYFARAIANRLWAWLMGRGVVDPPDELDVTAPSSPELLDVLARDLVQGGFDLERPIRAIVSTRAYALSSAAPDGSDEHAQVAAHATYPLKPLRGEPLAQAIYQATSFWKWDDRRALLLRFARYFQLADFSKRHGSDPDTEQVEQETLLQRLHLLNGVLVSERTKDDDIFGPTTRLPLLAPTDQAAVDAAFLMAFARRPTPDEARPWLERLGAHPGRGKDVNQARAQVMSDLQWALLNTTEFATNH